MTMPYRQEYIPDIAIPTSDTRDRIKAIEAWKGWHEECGAEGYEIGQWIAQSALNRLGVEVEVML